MNDEHEDDDENDDDSRTERDASAGEPSHGVDEERAGEPVTADEKPSRDVGDQPDESGERQGEITQPNDAFTVDESNRQNQLVKAEIDQSRKGMWVSAGLFAVALLMSFISFLATSSSWSFGFLAVPVATIIANLFEPIASRSSRDKEKRAEREPGKEDRQNA